MADIESLPYSERSILVLGGAGVNSIGRAAVDRFYELGTRDIYIGTTSWANFGRVIEDYADLGLPTNNLHPFVANVVDKISLATATKVIKTRGHGLTDIIFAHAGGMDGFLPQLLDNYLRPIRVKMRGASSLYRLDEAVQAEVRALMIPMYEQIKIWREEAIPHGIAVNYQGTLNAIDVLGEEFPENKRGAFINSSWGHVSGTENPETGETVQIPLLYGPVDIPKAMVRDHLRETAILLYRSGFPVAEEIATLVRGTRVGKTFQDFLMPISLPEQAAAMRNTAVDREDVVGGIRIIFEGNPNTWPNHHLELFVSGKEGKTVFSDHLEMSAMYSTPYPY